MELNKIFAAVLLAGVIAMTTGFLADLLVAPEELEENAYVVDVGEDTQVADGAAAEEEGIPDIATLLADADPAAGEGAFRACAACHTYEQGGPNRVGPNLWGVVGGPMAHVEGFNYSDALMERAAEGGEWTWENLNGFIHAPREWLPGTAMSYAGLTNDQDRADLLAWLNQQSDDPIALPEPAPAEETAEAPAEGASSEETSAEEAPAQAAAPEETAGEESTGTQTAGAETAEDTAAAESEAAPADEQQAADAAQTASAEDAAPASGENGAAPAAESQPLEIAQAEEAASDETASETAAPEEGDAAASQDTAAAPAATEEAATEEAAAEEAAAEETGTEEAATEEAAAEEAGGAGGFVAQVAAADPSQGQNVARACMACHTFEQGGGNRVGPNLWDVVGNDIAAAEGFRYSQAMQDFGAEHGQWSVELLGEYLAAPREVVPGTNMAYAGVRSEEDLAALVAWLRSLSENPVPLE